MNVDSIARLIESADVSAFRTLMVDFLPLVGLGDSVFSDGPYDGGADFVLKEQRVTGVKIGIQISVEKDWQSKVASDAAKTRARHGTNALYFLSSRRIPEGSWAKARAEILESTGVVVTKLDSQAIATEFIRAGKVEALLGQFGILPSGATKDGYLKPETEAVAAILIFGSDAREFRQGVFDSIVKSFLSREPEGIDRAALIEKVMTGLSFALPQGVLISSIIDRLMQSREVISSGGLLRLSESEKKKFEGLRAAARFELDALRENIDAYLSSRECGLVPQDRELVLANLLALAIQLVSEDVTGHTADEDRLREHRIILDLISSRIGQAAAEAVFIQISSIISQSQFAKRIAAAALYKKILAADSRLLISALGGSRGVSVYLDTSVFIPMMCSVLFDKGSDRFAKAGANLFSLLEQHEFSALVPDVYLEEVASHLVSACRDYRHLLSAGLEITRSNNAFVSHFSSLSNSRKNAGISFDDYVSVFGVRLSSLPAVVPDEMFYSLRDRVAAEFRRLMSRYKFNLVDTSTARTKGVRSRVLGIPGADRRPEILIRHDIAAVAHIEEQVVRGDDVKVLCTWDHMHIEINPSVNMATM